VVKNGQKWSALLAVGLVTACGSDDGAGDSGPLFDAAAPGDAFLSDAAVVDCAADYRESRDRSNDPLTVEGGEAEATGYVLRAASDPFTVCGQIDPAQTNDAVVDGDYFEFTVGGSSPINVRIELYAPNGEAASDLAIDLHRVEEGTPVFVASGPFHSTFGVIAGIPLEPGTYWVNAVAFQPAPQSPVLYSMAIARESLTCPRVEPADDYAEAGDDGGRGNDMVAVDHPDPPALTATMTDEPEPTGIQLHPASGPVGFTGVSAALESDGDSYLDRDSFLVRTGPETNEVQVRLNWPNGDDDLDMYLFAATNPERDFSVGLGAKVNVDDDELFTVSVEPDRNYWLWVGAYQGGSGTAIPYSVTICPRSNDGS